MSDERGRIFYFGAMRLRLVWLGLFAALWLAPFFWIGQMRQLPFKLPPRLLTQYACAGLFSKRMPSWSQVFIQIEHDGAGEWVTLPVTELSPMRVFGYRQRVDRLLLGTNSRKNDGGSWKRLAEWIASHPAPQKSVNGPVAGVRYVQQRWQIHSPELINSGGHWNCQAPDERSTTSKFQVLKSYDIVEGTARPTTSTPPTPEPRMKVPNVFRRTDDAAPPKEAHPKSGTE